MKILRLEAIGDDRATMMAQFGVQPDRPWVAELVGLNDQGGFNRRFLRPRKDYSGSNSVGSRGVMLHFEMGRGVYEVYEMTSWRGRRRYFAAVDGAKLYEITREDAEQYLEEQYRLRRSP